jgi:hypothetical protein
VSIPEYTNQIRRGRLKVMRANLKHIGPQDPTIASNKDKIYVGASWFLSRSTYQAWVQGAHDDFGVAGENRHAKTGPLESRAWTSVNQTKWLCAQNKEFTCTLTLQDCLGFQS